MILKEFLKSTALPYIVTLIIASHMMYGVWKKPDDFRRNNYMPWMDSYWGWNSYRIAISAFFFALVTGGVVIFARFFWELVVQLGKVMGL